MADDLIEIGFDIDEITFFLSDSGPAEIEFTTFVVTQVIGGSGGGAGYLHTQGSLSSVWTVAHNLGYRPAVSVTTTGGVEVLGGEVLHMSNDTLTITFDDAFTGYARCN